MQPVNEILREVYFGQVAYPDPHGEAQKRLKAAGHPHDRHDTKVAIFRYLYTIPFLTPILRDAASHRRAMAQKAYLGGPLR